MVVYKPNNFHFQQEKFHLTGKYKEAAFKLDCDTHCFGSLGVKWVKVMGQGRAFKMKIVSPISQKRTIKTKFPKN